jgi:hypothetical protein
MTALNPEFNALVLAFASRISYTLTDAETQSFEEMKALYKSTGSIPINTGFSDNTIFGNPAINWAFRAWHDYCHLLLDADFSEQGERETCELQIAQMFLALGHTEQAWRFASIIRGEVIGQVLYYQRFQSFPKNQCAFMTCWLNTGRIPEHTL